MLRRISLCILVTVTVASQALAYKEELHQRISKKALAVAAAQNDFYKRLGMNQNDITEAETWIQTGAYYEDFWPTVRVRNHFFDPLDQRGLTIPDAASLFPCSIQFNRADDWLLNPALGNTYTVDHAYDQLESAFFAPNPGTRSQRLYSVFDTLGHAAHLVEDMAQPEHTRNDQHLTFSGTLISSGASPSIWEEWSYANLVHGPEAYFENYPVVKLGTFRNYFSGLDRGMADYSNRNFFTQDTNESDERPFSGAPTGCYHFASPRVDLLSGVTRTVSELYYDSGFLARHDVDETYYTGSVSDFYTGAVDTDGAQTVQSLLDLETRFYGVRTFSLAEESYWTRSALLMPRATGYAAGILDHFFRGRIGAIWTETAPGTYRLVLTNKGSEPIGADAQLTVYMNSGPTASSSDDLHIVYPTTPLFTGIAPGGSVTIEDITPQDLTMFSLFDFERRILVTGTIGSERGAIPLVQPAGHGLQVVMKWTDSTSGEPPSFVIRENRNFFHLGVFYNSNQFRNEIPNTVFTLVNPHEAHFDIDPIAPGGYNLNAFLQGTEHQCNTFTNATVEWWAYGELVSTVEGRLTPCVITPMGTYP